MDILKRIGNWRIGTLNGETVAIDHRGESRKFASYNVAITTIERENGTPNYPFTDSMRFCADHSKDSRVADVVVCGDCRGE